MASPRRTGQKAGDQHCRFTRNREAGVFQEDAAKQERVAILPGELFEGAHLCSFAEKAPCMLPRL